MLKVSSHTSRPQPEPRENGMLTVNDAPATRHAHREWRLTPAETNRGQAEGFRQTYLVTFDEPMTWPPIRLVHDTVVQQDVHERDLFESLDRAASFRDVP